jgi:Ca2+-binding RTX toxin-like protein
VRGTRFDDTYNAVGFSGTSANAGSNGTFNEFEGGAGNDTITGNGNTKVAFHLATAGVTVDLAAGFATGDASVGTDTLTGGVNGAVGSRYDDTFYGSNNAPGTGEIFEGRAGNDYIDGRGGYDVANYGNDPAVTGGIYVNMAAGTVSGDASIGYDTLRSIEVVRGTNFADTYVATGFGSTSTNAGSNGTFNEFEGMGGNDTITGNGDTRISYASATGGVTVNLATGTASGNASVGTDHFTGVTRVRGSNFDDTITGGVTNDVLEGMDGDDVIDGKGGFDILTGGAGNDILTGGAGQDIFAFQNGFGEDVITDFNPGEVDQIDLSGVSGVTDFSTLMSLANQDGADTVIDFGNGDVIRLSNVYMYYLSSSDFIFASNSLTM